MNKGDPVQFYWNGWRTGTFLEVKENVKSSHKDFGKYRVRPNFLCKKEVLAMPEDVKKIGGEK